MNRKALLNSAAILMLLVAVSTIFVSSAFAHPGKAPGPPPPWDPPTTPDPPEPPGDGDTGSTAGDNKKSTSIITQIFKVMFDSSTMKDAIVNALDSIFNEGLSQLTNPTSPFYKMGAEASKIVFDTESLKEVRYSSWIQLRKVAFALLPLTAALTIWASMKDGLYSVTGYANTFEAVAEFFVSIAIALASFWLMEQAIGLVKTFSIAIAESLDIEITRSVFDGFVMKYSLASIDTPILTMIMSIFMFVFVLVFMGSVLIAFLAREVVIIITVALAPVMMILGSVRPLSWLRGLWSKAFLVFLLLLPINVLAMGIGVKFINAAGSLSTGTLASLFQLVILIGITSVLIAINGTLGKMVYGAAIEVAQKVGDALTQVAAMGATVVGMAATGGLGGAALAGTAGSLAPAAGGGSGAALSTAGTAAGGQITSTSNLTSTIGSALSTSGNRIVSGFGKGMRVGAAVKDHKLASAAPPPGAQLNVAKNGIPGMKQGTADSKEEINTPNKAAGIGSTQEILEERRGVSDKTSEATQIGLEENGLSSRDFLEQTHYLHPGKPDIAAAGRDYIRSEAGSYAFKGRGKFSQNELSNWTPNTPSLHVLDYQAAQHIVQNRQTPSHNLTKHITPSVVSDVARAVQAQRQNGRSTYKDIVGKANASASLQSWIDNSLGLT